MGSLLNKREQILFDSINEEVYMLAGAEDVYLWKWKKFFGPTSSVSGSVDCMYGEPILGTKHYQSYKIIAFFERPTQTANATDGGLEAIREGRVFISRRTLERAKVPVDKELDHVAIGDILEFFRRGKRFIFEIRQLEKDGWINDQDTWTQYIAEVVVNSTFTPDQKLVGSV